MQNAANRGLGMLKIVRRLEYRALSENIYLESKNTWDDLKMLIFLSHIKFTRRSFRAAVLFSVLVVVLCCFSVQPNSSQNK